METQTRYTSQGLFPKDSWVPALCGFELGKMESLGGKGTLPKGAQLSGWSLSFHCVTPFKLPPFKGVSLTCHESLTFHEEQWTVPESKTLGEEASGGKGGGGRDLGTEGLGGRGSILGKAKNGLMWGV